MQSMDGEGGVDHVGGIFLKEIAVREILKFISGWFSKASCNCFQT